MSGGGRAEVAIILAEALRSEPGVESGAGGKMESPKQTKQTYT